jgi:hypothetical protein
MPSNKPVCYQFILKAIVDRMENASPSKASKHWFLCCLFYGVARQFAIDLLYALRNNVGPKSQLD